MATDYFAAKKAQLAPIGTGSNASATPANVTPGKPAAVQKSPVGGSPMINQGSTKVLGHAPLAPGSFKSKPITSPSAPVPTAPIMNAANGGTSPATGYGGANYGTSGDVNKAISANQAQIANNPSFVQSEIQRTLDVMKNRDAQDLDNSAEQKYLTTNLGYNTTTGTSNLLNGNQNLNGIFDPGSYGGYDPTAQEKAYFDQQIAGYNGQSEAARLAMQTGLDTNNAYLQEQLKGLAAQNAVDNDAAQQLQNRRGGLYSGGLDYQLGAIGNAYANQQGNLMRDVATRNQSLIDQYGNQANTIAQQINTLTQAQPDILRNRIQEWVNNERNYGINYANTFGNLNGQDTMAQNQQNFNQMDTNRKFHVNTALDVGDRAGMLLAPQEDTKGLYRQINTGTTAAGTPVINTLEGVTNQSNIDIAKRTSALNEWTQAGYATPVVASILGVPEGTPTNDASYRSSSQQLDQDKFTYQQMTDKATANQNKAKTINASTAGDMLSGALQKVISQDDYGKPVYGVISDPNKREQAFVDLYNNYGVSGNDMVSALSKAGYTMNEINALKQHHPEVFQ